MTMQQTRDAVTAYFDAWTTQRVADAHAQLAPDLEFNDRLRLIA